MAANQILLADKMQAAMLPTFERYGLALDNFAVENIRCPKNSERPSTRAFPWAWSAIWASTRPVPGGPVGAPGGPERRRLAGVGAGLAAGVGMGQVMMDALRGTPGAAQPFPAATPHRRRPEARLAKLKALLDGGLVTQADYDAAKAKS